MKWSFTNISWPIKSAVGGGRLKGIGRDPEENIIDQKIREKDLVISWVGGSGP